MNDFPATGRAARHRRWRDLLILPVLVLMPAKGASAQEPSLATVLARAAQYVDQFVGQLAGIVSEERYEQDVIPASALDGITATAGRGAAPLGGAPRVARQHRVLRSDLLLVHPLGSSTWVQFRDVFEVDGNGVRDRDGRLAKLFLKPSESLGEQVKEIAADGARYNIGNLERTINLPVMALAFLQPDAQPRFEFTRASAPPAGKAGEMVVPVGMPKAAAFAVSADAWEIQFKETTSGTLVRTTADRDLPARGRFWIDPPTGRVLMSELVLDDPFVHASIEVGYQFDTRLGLLVPAEMREDYLLRSTGVRIRGTARYSRFRSFQVTIDEALTPVK